MTKKIEQGKMISQAVSEARVFSEKLIISMVIGEETGRLEDFLGSIAKSFEYETDSAISKLLTYIQPVLIVIMAGVIGTVILSVMLPMFKMYQNFG